MAATPRTDSALERIVDAAARLFAQQGFAATGTREIAAAVGISQPSIFHHFASKEDILREVSERALVRPLALLDRLRATERSAGARLAVTIRFHVRLFEHQPYDLVAILQAPGLPPTRFRQYHRSVTRYTDGIRALIEEGSQRGEFIAADSFTSTMAILGMCNWMIRWYKGPAPLSADQISAEFARFSLRSVLADPGRLAAVEDEAAHLWAELELEALLAGSA